MSCDAPIISQQVYKCTKICDLYSLSTINNAPYIYINKYIFIYLAIYIYTCILVDTLCQFIQGYNPHSKHFIFTPCVTQFHSNNIPQSSIEHSSQIWFSNLRNTYKYYIYKYIYIIFIKIKHTYHFILVIRYKTLKSLILEIYSFVIMAQCKKM